MIGKEVHNLISCNLLITIALPLFLACSGQPVTSYKLVLVQDSSNRPQSLGELKAAKLAIEEFNAETDINGRHLELEVLELAEVELGSATALQSYIKQLQRGAVKRSVSVVGFVMGRSQSVASEQFQQILSDKGWVLVGIWPDELAPSRGALRLSIVPPMYASNEYLLKYIVERRYWDTVYVVYDEQHRGMAEDFLFRSREVGLNNAAKLQYIKGRANYDQGTIRSLADLLRNQRFALFNEQQRKGIVLFLDQRNAEESNSYLARSPYRYLFGKFDVILNNDELELSQLDNPKSRRYFVMQQQEYQEQRQNYQKLQSQYRRIYHLSMSREVVELYDAVSLLAYTAKKTIESLGTIGKLYQNLLQGEFKGSTGRLVFDEQGQRLANYVILQWRNELLEIVESFPLSVPN